ncbi:hypothetical protein G7Y89_g3842 [Cudoniella acicularis]|uniref:Uncharacterized protein n=1 Tax=Cudoniella acicularis TaxID=354080 RepID=A0A8H4W797_9HELO|nr:hypothetical protein G7Y89_g3842 [Cudoniella acicularis]
MPGRRVESPSWPIVQAVKKKWLITAGRLVSHYQLCQERINGVKTILTRFEAHGKEELRAQEKRKKDVASEWGRRNKAQIDRTALSRRGRDGPILGRGSATFVFGDGEPDTGSSQKSKDSTESQSLPKQGVPSEQLLPEMPNRPHVVYPGLTRSASMSDLGSMGSDYPDFMFRQLRARSRSRSRSNSFTRDVSTRDSRSSSSGPSRIPRNQGGRESNPHSRNSSGIPPSSPLDQGFETDSSTGLAAARSDSKQSLLSQKQK